MIDHTFFDQPVKRRGTGCVKWDAMPADDVIPMWVADMDFPSPPAVQQALLARAAHGLGLNVWTYTGYLFEHLRDAGDPAWTALLAETDVLVDGPFLQKEKSYELHFRGSRNQRLIDVPASLAQGKVVLWEEEDLLAKFTVPES